MMHVLHIVWSFNFGGIQTMIVDLVNEQSRESKVSLIVINSNIAESLMHKISPNVRVYRINRKIGSLGFFKILKLNWIVHSLKADKIHCHFHNQIKTLFFIPKRKLNLTVHDVNRPINNLRRYAKLFTISNAVHDDILKRGNLESTVVYNGLRLGEIAVKEDYKINHLKIVQISRLLHKKKGQDILLRAIHYLIMEKKFKNLSLSFIGEGDSEIYLKNLVSELNLTDYVRFEGYKDRKFIYENLKNYDLLVQPSRYEGFGITVIEAMAAGIPILVSAIDGPLEITRNGKYGYLFKSNDYIQCANQIMNIRNDLKSPRIYKKLDEAREYVNNTFSIGSTAEKYLNNYN